VLCISGLFILFHSYLCIVKKHIILYSLSMAALLFVLKAIDYKYLVYDLQTEYYIGIIALFFTIFGLWIGRKLTTKPSISIAAVPTIATAKVIPDELGISPREVEVIRLIAAGHSNQEIADTLYLSLNTVKKHTSSIFRKLEAERRTQAIEKARRFGLID